MQSNETMFTTGHAFVRSIACVALAMCASTPDQASSLTCRHFFESTPTTAGQVSSDSAWAAISPASQVRAARFFRSEQPLIETLGLDPGRATQIVLLSFSDFLGDNFVFTVSLVDSLRKLHPQIPLSVLSPVAGALAQGPNARFASASVSTQFFGGERALASDRLRAFIQRLPGFLRANIRPGAFVFFDLTTLEKAEREISMSPEDYARRPTQELARVLTDIGAAGVGLSLLAADGRLGVNLTSVAVIAPVGRLREPPPNLTAEPLLSRSGRAQGLRFTGFASSSRQTIYESWQTHVAAILGRSVALRWSAQDVANVERSNDEVDEFLHASGIAPQRRIAVLNLNARGSSKVRQLTPHYVSILRALVDHALLSDPELDLLIPFPESQFGPETQAAAMDFLAQRRGRAAFIPVSDRELIPALLNRAAWVASYDSGLVHLANFLPSDRVLTFSLDQGQSRIWRRPGQPFVQIAENGTSDDLIDGVQRWISRATPRVPGGTRLEHAGGWRRAWQIFDPLRRSLGL